MGILDKDSWQYKGHLQYVAAYQKEYRRKHPERARQWQENATLKRAAAIMARREAEAAKEGADSGDRV